MLLTQQELKVFLGDKQLQQQLDHLTIHSYVITIHASSKHAMLHMSSLKATH